MKLRVRDLGKQDYQYIWYEMRKFTLSRTSRTQDEIWLLEHPAVFTQGQAGKPEHILELSNIPIVNTDRGGQVTYHGPGQLIAYLLVDIKRLKINIRQFVHLIESSVIELLASYQVKAHRRTHAPGVYIDDAKVCSLGLRVRHGCSYHGLALNINSDLMPFSQINPCGFKGLKMINFTQYAPNASFNAIKTRIVGHIAIKLGYTQYEFINSLKDVTNGTEITTAKATGC